MDDHFDRGIETATEQLRRRAAAGAAQTAPTSLSARYASPLDLEPPASPEPLHDSPPRQYQQQHDGSARHHQQHERVSKGERAAKSAHSRSAAALPAATPVGGDALPAATPVEARRKPTRRRRARPSSAPGTRRKAAAAAGRAEYEPAPAPAPLKRVTSAQRLRDRSAASRLEERAFADAMRNEVRALEAKTAMCVAEANHWCKQMGLRKRFTGSRTGPGGAYRVVYTAEDDTSMPVSSEVFLRQHEQLKTQLRTHQVKPGAGRGGGGGAAEQAPGTAQSPTKPPKQHKLSRAEIQLQLRNMLSDTARLTKVLEDQLVTLDHRGWSVPPPPPQTMPLTATASRPASPTRSRAGRTSPGVRQRPASASGSR